MALVGVFILSGCENECNMEEPETYPSLRVVNNLKDDWRSITRVSLLGYEFTNLDIEANGGSQTFVLDSGMSGGYDNINITVSYRRYTNIGSSRSEKFNFENGKTTTVTLTGCDGAEGCDGIYLK